MVISFLLAFLDVLFMFCSLYFELSCTSLFFKYGNVTIIINDNICCLCDNFSCNSVLELIIVTRFKP